MFVQCRDLRCLLVSGPVDAALDGQRDTLQVGPEASNATHDFLPDLGIWHAYVHFHRCRVGHYVGPCAALDQTHADSEFTCVVGHLLQGQHLMGNLVDGIATEVMFDAGVRCHTMGRYREAGAALAGGHDLAARARWLGDQYKLRAPRFAHDVFARSVAAHLLVADHQMPHRQVRLQAFARNLTQGGQRQIGAALHVLGARPVGAVALDAERQRAGQRADWMHGINVAQNQHPLALGGLWRTVPVVDGQQVVAEPVATGNALHPHANGLVVGLHTRRHAGHARRVIGRALDFDPGPNTGQYFIHIKLLSSKHLKFLLL